MNQRPQNDHLRVNKTGKYIRKSIFHQVHSNANLIALTQPQPQTQVYIINKNDFKSIVQQLTSSQSSEHLPQNHPNRQKIKSEPINRTSSVSPIATEVQEDPRVSMYVRCLENLLEESSESNGDQLQQPFDEYQSYMLTQAHSQPQSSKQSMPYSDDLVPVLTTTLPSPWFDGSPQQMHGAYSLQSTREEYPQPLTPNFIFSSMTQPRVFDPDQGHF